jgi:hypothetical protein
MAFECLNGSLCRISPVLISWCELHLAFIVSNCLLEIFWCFIVQNMPIGADDFRFFPSGMDCLICLDEGFFASRLEWLGVDVVAI